MKRPDGSAALERFFERLPGAPARVLLLDYDGTLAPFRVERDEAVPYAGVREAVRGRYVESLDETRLDLAERIEELATSDPNLVFLRARLLDDASEGTESVEALEQADHAARQIGRVVSIAAV